MKPVSEMSLEEAEAELASLKKAPTNDKELLNYKEGSVDPESGLPTVPTKSFGQRLDEFNAIVGGIGTGAVDQIINLGNLANKATGAPVPDVGNLLTNNLRQQVGQENETVVDVASTVGGILPFGAANSIKSLVGLGAATGAANELANNPQANALEVLGGGAKGVVMAGAGYGLASVMGKMFVNKDGAVKPKPQTTEDFVRAGDKLKGDIGYPQSNLQSQVKAGAAQGLEAVDSMHRPILRSGYKNVGETPIDVNKILQNTGELTPNQQRALEKAMDSTKGNLKPNQKLDSGKGVDLIKRNLEKQIAGAERAADLTKAQDLKDLRIKIITQADQANPEYQLMRALAKDNADMMDELLNTPIGKLRDANPSTKRAWAKNLIESGDDAQFEQGVALLKDPKLKRELVSEYIDEGIRNISGKSYQGGTPLDIIRDVVNGDKLKRINSLLKDDINSKAKLEALQKYWVKLDPSTDVNKNLKVWQDPSKMPYVRNFIDSKEVKFLKKSFDFITDPSMNRQFRQILKNSNGDYDKIITDTIKLIEKGKPKSSVPISKRLGAGAGVSYSSIIDNYAERNKDNK